MSLEGQKCRGELVRMASKWRIDGVFSDMRIEKKGGQVLTRVGLLVRLYSVAVVAFVQTSRQTLNGHHNIVHPAISDSIS